ncbi:MAG: hypothetical protein GKR96_13505 [Gammaproteobacteria bacterium]|nr:hypothetical protein [Gammaproteobacteria bacterium]
MPIPITFFLWTLAHTFNATSLLNPLVFLPFSKENQKRKFIINLLKEKDSSAKLKPQMKELEDILIFEAIARANGIQKDAALELGISPSKISSQMGKQIRHTRKPH